jgi:SpoVK/Ycf46/Vps4 family AAA+-type ATPase
MDFSSKNSAYKDFFEQAQEAYSEGNIPRAKELFLKAASLTNEITLKNTNPEIKKNYYNITISILDFVKKNCSLDNDVKIPNPSEQQKQVEGTIKVQTLEQSLESLNALIGLENVKRTVNEWIETYKISKLRSEFGLKNPVMSLHMVFLGNPGTGKTTVARLIGQIYKSLGILSTGNLVEVTRTDLVGTYIGATAQKTREILKKSHGGVLFIDEAYSLVNGSENDFGNESITTLLKDMDDNRNLYAVIVAGYENKMNKFINSNPGLMSRLNTKVFFEDYDSRSLMQIFNKFCEENDYIVDPSAIYKLEEHFREIFNSRDEKFGNGREARNIFEQVIKNLSSRVSKIYAATKEDVSTIIDEDIYFTKEKTYDAL